MFSNQMKFMIVATLVGTFGTFLISPFCGVCVYWFYAVLRPQYFWKWVLPPDVEWSFYVGLAVILAALLHQLGMFSSEEDKDVPPTAARWTKAQWMVVIFGLWVSLAFITSQKIAVSWPWYYDFAKVLVMFVAMGFFIRKVNHVWILVLITAFSLAYVGWEVNYAYFVNHNISIYRSGYSGLDNNGAGLMLAMGVPLCYFAWEGLQRWYRWLFLLLIPVLVHSVLMTYSRGAMVALSAFVVLALVRGRQRVWAITGVVILGLMIPFMAGKEIQDRFFTMTRDEVDESANSRLLSWKAAWGIAKDYPLVGVGFRMSNKFSHQYGADLEGRTIHSQYLQILADNGFPGLGLYLAMLAMVWWETHKVRKAAKRKATDILGRRAYASSCAVESSMAVFCLGASFLSLENFELPYLMLLLGSRLSVVMPQPASVDKAETDAEEMDPISSGPEDHDAPRADVGPAP